MYFGCNINCQVKLIFSETDTR